MEVAGEGSGAHSPRNKNRCALAPSPRAPPTAPLLLPPPPVHAEVEAGVEPSAAAGRRLAAVVVALI